MIIKNTILAQKKTISCSYGPDELCTSQTVRPPWNDRFRSSCNTYHPIQIPGVPCTRGAMGSGIH